MGRVDARGDNAVLESFFALLQKNVLGRQRWAEPKRVSAGGRPLDRASHRRRRQRRLGHLIPVEYETLTSAATVTYRAPDESTKVGAVSRLPSDADIVQQPLGLRLVLLSNLIGRE